MTDIRKELSSIMEDKHIDTWLNTPNPSLRDKSPQDLIDEGRVDIIRDIIREVEQGSFL